jgi:hypothetical protein
MAFESRVVEARLALNLISSTEMPRLAWEALEAGLDGPVIRRLAAFEFPTFFQVQEALPQAMEEMRWRSWTNRKLLCNRPSCGHKKSWQRI